MKIPRESKAKARWWRWVVPPWKRARIILAFFLVLLALVFGWTGCLPRRRSHEPLGQLLQGIDDGVRERVENTVRELSGDVGPRYPPLGDSMARAAMVIERKWRELGFDVQEQAYDVGGVEVKNLMVVLPGLQPELGIFVVGAHYDTCFDTPGADDNASGVALLLELSRSLRGQQPERSIWLVAFACEEPPYFLTPDMGSVRLAHKLVADGIQVEGMISLESLGYYRDEAKTQHYPSGLSLFYPNRGNFVAVVGNLSSNSLARRVARLMKEHSQMPVETGVLPGWLPGVGWSDHWAFWKQGVAAVMLTDTALFRNPHYHDWTDAVDTLNYDALADLGMALPQIVLNLASARQ
ncbi:MAG: M28 family peptidase [Planctomycetota bacterium]